MLTLVVNAPQDARRMYDSPADANTMCEQQGETLPLYEWLQRVAVQGGDSSSQAVEPLASCKNLACVQAVMTHARCYDPSFQSEAFVECAYSTGGLSSGTVIVNMPTTTEPATVQFLPRRRAIRRRRYY